MSARAELLHAYLTTRYVVVEDGSAGGAEAIIDARSAAIDAVLKRHGARSGVFITAWNPRSQPQRRQVNEAAQQRLEAELCAGGVAYLPHRGQGANPAWEAEHGVLALNLAMADALSLAEAYGQNAVVAVHLDQPARLVLTALMPADPAG